jgi:hypothetical protein
VWFGEVFYFSEVKVTFWRGRRSAGWEFTVSMESRSFRIHIHSIHTRTNRKPTPIIVTMLRSSPSCMSELGCFADQARRPAANKLPTHDVRRKGFSNSRNPFLANTIRAPQSLQGLINRPGRNVTLVDLVHLIARKHAATQTPNFSSG